MQYERLKLKVFYAEKCKAASRLRSSRRPHSRIKDELISCRSRPGAGSGRHNTRFAMFLAVGCSGCGCKYDSVSSEG